VLGAGDTALSAGDKEHAAHLADRERRARVQADERLLERGHGPKRSPSAAGRRRPECGSSIGMRELESINTLPEVTPLEN
jgi:hypothetical protein